MTLKPERRRVPARAIPREFIRWRSPRTARIWQPEGSTAKYGCIAALTAVLKRPSSLFPWFPVRPLEVRNEVDVPNEMVVVHTGGRVAGGAADHHRPSAAGSAEGAAVHSHSDWKKPGRRSEDPV